jgi:hypothetical protein
MRYSLLAVLAVVATQPGCMDREPGPVCPVPRNVVSDDVLLDSYNGVDLLVVVDNSGSMEQEQQILSTGFFTLINSLVEPVSGPDWPYPEVENMKVAVVSSDLGLQYGSSRSVDGFPYDSQVPTCTDGDPRGDDGSFQTDMPGTIEVQSGEVSCNDDARQCPESWTCVDGSCRSPSGDEEAVNCPGMSAGDDWAETATERPNEHLAEQVACLASLGTAGCGIEQQLEAAVLGLSREDQQGFMDSDHLLAVLIVSDEEDCSIEDPGLFETDEWRSGTLVKNGEPGSGLLNTACNLPERNEEEFLFQTSRYWEQLVELKGGEARGVVFAAIVGVPAGEESTCQGRGNELEGCLEAQEMQLEVEINDQDGVPYKHFGPACERYDESGVEPVTSARPGRRFVKVAESFGANGYVYSICNPDWSPAMKEIAKVIAGNVCGKCYPDKLEWTPSGGCEVGGEKETCGAAKCDVVVSFEYTPETAPEKRICPAELGVSPDEARESVEKDNAGRPKLHRVTCPLPKLEAPIDCESAERMHDGTDAVGWFYCENQEESFDENCMDGIDNDGDGAVDCKDEGCSDCALACGGTGIECGHSCKYGLELTTGARDVVRGHSVTVQCLGQFAFEDGNCRENSLESCTDGEDNDGNGVWDCDHAPDHFADPGCCPLTKEKTGNCRLEQADDGEDLFARNCPGSSRNDLPDACAAAALAASCSL